MMQQHKSRVRTFTEALEMTHKRRQTQRQRHIHGERTEWMRNQVNIQNSQNYLPRRCSPKSAVSYLKSRLSLLRHSRRVCHLVWASPSSFRMTSKEVKASTWNWTHLSCIHFTFSVKSRYSNLLRKYLSHIARMSLHAIFDEKMAVTK